MSEIVRDGKYTNIELTTDLGITFDGNNPRLRHTGTGTFTISSTQGKINVSSGSTASDSLNLDSAGGIDVDGAGLISIETSDTTNGLKIAQTTNMPVDIGSGGGTLVMGKLGETAQFRGSLTIDGDLTVSGDTVSHDVVTVQTEDPVLRLNEGATGTNAVDIGFVGDRGSDANIGFIWDESADEFATVFITDDTQLSLTGTPQNTVFTDYADIHCGTGTFDDTLYAAGQRFSVTEVTGNTLVNEGTFTVTSTTNSANAIRLNTNGGTTETINISNTQGTSESAIAITSTAGGVDIDAAAGKNVDIGGGQIIMLTKDDVVGAISLTANIGTTETITVHNIQGTSEGAIAIGSFAGGVDIDAAATKNIDISGGQVLISSKDNIASAIALTANVGSSETIVITNTQGTSTSSINLVSTAGGITLTTNGNAAITVENDSTVGINTNNPDNTYALDVNGTTNTTGLYQNDSLLLPPGCIMPYAAGSAPGGWLLCDGSAVSRSTYSSLFAVISTTYGSGDGSTTFNLPDIRGRFIIGLKSTDGDFDALGETGGSKTATLTTNELPAHTHTGTTDSDGAHTHGVTDPGHTHSVSGTLQTTGNDTSAGQDSTSGEPDVTTTVSTTSSSSTTGISVDSGGAHTHTFTTGSTGSGNAFSLMNPYFTLNYIIKT